MFPVNLWLRWAVVVIVAGFAMAFGVSESRGATFTVRAIGSGSGPTANYLFSPTNITINVGDSIVWTNAHLSAPHDSTAGIANSGTNNGWAWPTMSAFGGTRFTNTFNAPGYFPFRCRTHTDAGATTLTPQQTGSVTVVAIGVPPSLSLTNPTSGRAVAAPASFNLQAGVTNGSGAVTNVEFFAGASSLGSDPTAPFSLLTAALGAGNYSFTAVASANDGFRATSAPVSVFVLTNATLLTPALTGNVATLTVTGFVGQTYFIDVTTNFTNWSTISTTIAPANVFTVPDTNAGASNRFYRARQVTN
jgi:plastocyanin